MNVERLSKRLRAFVMWMIYPALAVLLIGCLPDIFQESPTPTSKPPAATATHIPVNTPVPTPTLTPSPTATATKAPLPTPSGDADIEIIIPKRGDSITSPIHIEGWARVFEGLVQIRLKDASGKVLAQETVQASAGTGTWGQFYIDVFFIMPAQSQQGRLEVYSLSARDGSEINMVKFPLRLAAQ